MSNPFFDPKPAPVEPEQEVDPDNKPTLRCRKCDNEIVRSDVDAQWTHLDEEVDVKTGKSNYDHSAIPAYIEARVIE